MLVGSLEIAIPLTLSTRLILARISSILIIPSIGVIFNLSSNLSVVIVVIKLHLS